MWRSRWIATHLMIQIRRQCSTALHDELCAMTGLQSHHVSALIKSNSQMLASEWSSYLNRLADLGFSSSQRTTLLRHNITDVSNTVSIARLISILELLSSLDIPNPCSVIAKEPWLVLKKSEDLETTINYFGQFLTMAQVRQIVRHHPVVLSLSPDDITARYLYVILEMQMSPEVMSARCLWGVNLRTIRDRHTFLMRTGRYKTNTVRRQSVANQKHTLNRFLSCHLEEFVENIAGLTMEEWDSFYKMQRGTETVWDFE